MKQSQWRALGFALLATSWVVYHLLHSRRLESLHTKTMMIMMAVAAAAILAALVHERRRQLSEQLYGPQRWRMLCALHGLFVLSAVVCMGELALGASNLLIRWPAALTALTFLAIEFVKAGRRDPVGRTNSRQ